MSLPLLLTVLSVAVAVTVMGVLSAMIADDRLARARGWAFASMGLAVGIVACSVWHSVPAGRVAALVLVLQGGIVFERWRRDTRAHREIVADEESTNELVTERRP